MWLRRPHIESFCKDVRLTYYNISSLYYAQLTIEHPWWTNNTTTSWTVPSRSRKVSARSSTWSQTSCAWKHRCHPRPSGSCQSWSSSGRIKLRLHAEYDETCKITHFAKMCGAHTITYPLSIMRNLPLNKFLYTSLRTFLVTIIWSQQIQ